MSTLAKILIALALLAALFGAEQYVEHLGYTRAKTEAAVVIKQLKIDAGVTLADEIAKTRAAETALQAALNTQNLKDADHETTVNDLSERLRHLAGPAGRLRDPHATAGCRSGGGGTTGAAVSTAIDRPENTTEAGGLLSAELSGLLQRLTQEADDINVAYASCRADAYTVRAPH